MPNLTGTLTANGQESAEIRVAPGQSYAFSLSSSPNSAWTAALLSRSEDSLAGFTVIGTYSSAQALTEFVNSTGRVQYLRIRAVNTNNGAETITYRLQSLISGGRRYVVAHRPKVGTTSGWVVNAANNVGLTATLPASQTSSTLVIALDNVEIGDRIRGFYPLGQVESGGNTATLTCELRKITAAAADVVDASVATTGAVSFTADAIVGRVTMPCDQLDVLVAEGETFYFLITGTTALATDFALQGVVVQVERQ